MRPEKNLDHPINLMKSCNHCYLIIISRFLSFLPTKKTIKVKFTKIHCVLDQVAKKLMNRTFYGYISIRPHLRIFFGSLSKLKSENWCVKDFKPILILLINLLKVLEFPKGSLPITPTMLMNRIQSNASFDWDFSDEEHYPTIKASPNR